MYRRVVISELTFGPTLGQRLANLGPTWADQLGRFQIGPTLSTDSRSDSGWANLGLTFFICRMHTSFNMIICTCAVQASLLNHF